MPEPKARSRVIRGKKAGNSPSPSMDASCGHSHCGEICRVRYIGPVTHIRDHHILHVARGVSHIWTAVIIAGLAVVLTGAVAFSSVNAANQRREDIRTTQSTNILLNKLQSMEDRLGAMEKQVQDLSYKPITVGISEGKLPPPPQP
jgi:hypothetical protein